MDVIKEFEYKNEITRTRKWALE